MVFKCHVIAVFFRIKEHSCVIYLLNVIHENTTLWYFIFLYSIDIQLIESIF